MTGFPRWPDDITAPRLSQCLSLRYPDIDISHCEILQIIYGTATKVQLRLTYRSNSTATPLPETLWLKAGLEQHSPQNASLYALETAFYRDIAPDLKALCPVAYFAETDGSQSLLLMEDLLQRGIRFSDASRPLSVEQAKAVLVQLATLHARYWHSESLGMYSWLPEGSSLRDSGAIHFLFDDANWPRMMALPRNLALPNALKDRESMRSKMMALLEVLASNAHCLIHGDAHAGNLGFDAQDRALLFDWQTVMKGYWVHDVAHFMISALSIDDRRRYEKELLQYYLQCLARHGIAAPDWEPAWAAYRRHALYSYSWMLCPPEWQPDEICRLCAQRAEAAIIDLDTLALW